MSRPYELSAPELQARLDEMVDLTIGDLVSEFLLIPRGTGFIEYSDFQTAYETLKRHTDGFADFTEASVLNSMRENSRVLCIVRAILGMTPPEWAELARSELESDISQGAARSLDKKCRGSADYFSTMEARIQARRERRPSPSSSPPPSKSLDRIGDLVRVAIQMISHGAPDDTEAVIHRLDKFDTRNGLESLRYASREDAPYAVLLYERYLGRPFAGHRDAVSELVGEVMENAVEDRLREAGVTYRKTKRAERIPGFGQAPDFCVPDEIHPAVIIEAKITSDDGTARDKVARIKVLAEQRDRHVSEGRQRYEVVACIDGRGFRERREDMRQMLTRLDGKVFTSATLAHLITFTNLGRFSPRPR